MKKYVKMKIDDKIIVEAVKSEENGVLKTKHYEVKKNCGQYYCEVEGFVCACILYKKGIIDKIFR